MKPLKDEVMNYDAYCNVCKLAETDPLTYAEYEAVAKATDQTEVEALAASLEEDLERANTELETLRQENQELHQELLDMEETLEVERSQVGELTYNNDLLENQVSDLQEDLDRTQDEFLETARELSDAMDSDYTDVLEYQIQLLNEDLEGTRQDLFAAANEVSEAYCKVEELEDTLERERDSRMHIVGAEDSQEVNEYPHYFKPVPTTSHVDVYWVLTAWEVHCPAVAHAVKKLLCAGQRGVKDRVRDLEEAVASVKRAIELEEMK